MECVNVLNMTHYPRWKRATPRCSPPPRQFWQTRMFVFCPSPPVINFPRKLKPPLIMSSHWTVVLAGYVCMLTWNNHSLDDELSSILAIEYNLRESIFPVDRMGTRAAAANRQHDTACPGHAQRWCAAAQERTLCSQSYLATVCYVVLWTLLASKLTGATQLPSII